MSALISYVNLRSASKSMATVFRIPHDSFIHIFIIFDVYCKRIWAPLSHTHRARPLRSYHIYGLKLVDGFLHRKSISACSESTKCASLFSASSDSSSLFHSLLKAVPFYEKIIRVTSHITLFACYQIS